MAENLKDIEVTLENPVKIAGSGGTQEEATVVMMRAPSVNVRKQFAKMKQLCTTAEIDIMERAKGLSDGEPPETEEPKEKPKDEEEPDDDNNDGYAGMLSSTDIDFDAVYDAFTHILTIGKCGFIGGQPITKSIVGDFSMKDFERIFGAYAHSFF